jgi:hypothetical protein
MESYHLPGLESGFDSQWGRNIYLCNHYQISPEAYPACYRMGTFFPSGKVARA